MYKQPSYKSPITLIEAIYSPTGWDITSNTPKPNSGETVYYIKGGQVDPMGKFVFVYDMNGDGAFSVSKNSLDNVKKHIVKFESRGHSAMEERKNAIEAIKDYIVGLGINKVSKLVNDVMVETNRNGSITVSDIIDGHRVYKTYYDYSEDEAVELFKDEYLSTSKTSAIKDWLNESMKDKYYDANPFKIEKEFKADFVKEINGIMYRFVKGQFGWEVFDKVEVDGDWRYLIGYPKAMSNLGVIRAFTKALENDDL